MVGVVAVVLQQQPARMYAGYGLSDDVMFHEKSGTLCALLQMQAYCSNTCRNEHVLTAQLVLVLCHCCADKTLSYAVLRSPTPILTMNWGRRDLPRPSQVNRLGT